MKPCPHFLKRFAVLAAASLILSAVTLSASAAAAPVKYEEKRSTVTTVDGAQKKKDLAVTVEYQVGSTSIRAYTVEKDEVIGVSKDMWSLYGAFTSDWITDGTYTLSQPLNSVEQITVSVPYGDTARTNESYFVFHVPEGTVVTTPSWSYDMDLYKGKTIADVKAVVEAGQDPNTLIDIEDDYDPFGPDLEYTDTSAIYHLRKGYLYRVSVSSGFFMPHFLSGSTPLPSLFRRGCRCRARGGIHPPAGLRVLRARPAQSAPPCTLPQRRPVK